MFPGRTARCTRRALGDLLEERVLADLVDGGLEVGVGLDVVDVHVAQDEEAAMDDAGQGGSSLRSDSAKIRATCVLGIPA